MLKEIQQIPIGTLINEMTLICDDLFIFLGIKDGIGQFYYIQGMQHLTLAVSSCNYALNRSSNPWIII